MEFLFDVREAAMVMVMCALFSMLVDDKVDVMPPNEFLLKRGVNVTIGHFGAHSPVYRICTYITVYIGFFE